MYRPIGLHIASPAASQFSNECLLSGSMALPYAKVPQNLIDPCKTSFVILHNVFRSIKKQNEKADLRNRRENNARAVGLYIRLVTI